MVFLLVDTSDNRGGGQLGGNIQKGKGKFADGIYYIGTRERESDVQCSVVGVRVYVDVRGVLKKPH